MFRLIEKSISPACELVRQNQFSNIDVLPGSGTDLMETGNSSHSRSFINLPKELFEMLASAGPYLYRDTLLLQKVCVLVWYILLATFLCFSLILIFYLASQASKVLRAYYLCALELVNNGYVAFSSHTFTNGNENPRLHLKDARLRIEEALGTCLLPSLQLIPANPAVGQEIWELMSLLPYEVEFQPLVFFVIENQLG